MHRPIILAALLAGACLARPAQAAESYDNCAGFIDSVPATITTQGVWCLRKDVSTANTSGNAITVNANNVTIDCNDFKIGGLAAGEASKTIGIFADGRQNVTIRHCGVRGFHTAIRVQYGAGALIEDNRLDNNLMYGVFANGDNGRIRRNAIYDTGGATDTNSAYAIFAKADIVDNDIQGMFAKFPTAIETSGHEVSGNRIADIEYYGDGAILGILGNGSRTSIVGNQVYASTDVSPGVGIYSARFCANNTVSGFATAYSCSKSLDNMQ